MPVQIKCPNPSCHAAFQVDEALLGRNARCKSCGQKFPLQSMDGVSSTPSVDPSQRARATMLGQESTAGEPAPPLPRPQGETPAQVGRFQVRQCLGWGTFGTVYRAYDPQLDREVALKVPKPEVLDRPGRVERFLREGRAAARLRHPHIIPVFEAGQDGKNYYIASAFIEGSSLAGAIVAEEKGLDIRRAVRIVWALAEAVAYAHEQGIVHRDIKPANVMLDRKDQPLLMDFGLAARAEDQEKLTQDGAVLGTPAYMAPEQAAGQKGEAQPAADQYALGAVLYELLTGRPPYEGLPVIVLHNVINTPVQPPRELRKDLPADLEAICLKALAKKPEDRYPGCQDLADALGVWLDSQAKPMRPASVPETGSWWQAELGRQEEKTRPSAGGTGDFGELIPGVSPAKESVKKEGKASQRGVKRRASGWRGWVGNRWPVVAAAGAAALLVLLGIIIIIKWKSGEVSVEIKTSEDQKAQGSGTGEKGPAAPQPETLVEQVRKSMDRSKEYLIHKQSPDGHWDIEEPNSYPGGPTGPTSLVLLALLHAGVPPEDPVIQKGLIGLRKLHPETTYVVGLQTMVFCQAGLNEDRPHIQRNVHWLENAQVMKEGTLAGWTYTQKGAPKAPFSDNSNSHYAILGLHEAQAAGINVNPQVWEQIGQLYMKTQVRGGWGYIQGMPPTLTMTTAGLCDLLMATMDLDKNRNLTNGEGHADHCGFYKEAAHVANAQEWLADQFPDPKQLAAKPHFFYFLFDIEGAGRLTGLHFIGQHDWYRVGCQHLIQTQAPMASGRARV